MNTLKRWQLPALLIGLIAAAATAAPLFLHIDLTFFFRAYLFAYIFILGLSLGSLCLIMLHNLTGGDWGIQIRPLIYAGARTLPLLALFFIPICFGLPALYPWAHPELVAHNDILAHRQIYFAPLFFFSRAALYFLIWLLLALFITRARRPNRALSAAGLILYLWTMTHAGTDWIMSRDIDFYSTAFGFILTVGQTLSALALSVALISKKSAPIPEQPTPSPIKNQKSKIENDKPILNDLGNLLLTLVILWAYVSFMQLLVIWMGNSHDDNTWYLARGLGGGGDSAAWRIVGGLLLLFEFFVPFYILLFRRAKQNSAALTTTALILLAAHILEQYWLVAPSGHDAAPIFDPHWIDLTALFALAGLWFFLFLFLLRPIPPAAELPPSSVPEGAPAHD